MKKIAQKFLNLSEFTRFFMTNEIKNKIISRFVLLFIQLYLREIFIGMDGSQNYSSSKLTKMPYLSLLSSLATLLTYFSVGYCFISSPSLRRGGNHGTD